MKKNLIIWSPVSFEVTRSRNNWVKRGKWAENVSLWWLHSIQLVSLAGPKSGPSPMVSVNDRHPDSTTSFDLCMFDSVLFLFWKVWWGTSIIHVTREFINYGQEVWNTINYYRPFFFFLIYIIIIRPFGGKDRISVISMWFYFKLKESIIKIYNQALAFHVTTPSSRE